MATRYIGAREANQQFSALLKMVEDDGVTVIITRRGRSIVQMQRAFTEVDADAVEAQMDAHFAKHARLLKFHGGVNRAELHDRNREPDV